MAKTYITTVGLEIHAELKTATKMFCNSKNDPDEKLPNANICPICMGHPGTLPTINKEAVRHVLRVGHAIGANIADFTEFDRKNYFYPDIPKGYQLSQYKFPLVSGGTLNGVAITRVHLEEDTARSTHDAEGSEGFSLVDFNRAGVPLMELVTEPVIHSAEQASAFAKELQLLLRYLGAGEANMEKGEMRVEANISVSDDPNKFGTKVEVKNLNSFRAVERAIAYEVERHVNLLERDEADKLFQETRGWDETKQKTFSQRQKEDSHDYRYFPDPDLPKLRISLIPEFSAEALRSGLPELPWVRRSRFQTDFALTDKETTVFVENLPLGAYFEAVLQELSNQGTKQEKRSAESTRLAANYLLSDYLGLLKSSGKDPEDKAAIEQVSPRQFSELIALIEVGEVSSRGAKDTLGIMYKDGGAPKEIAEKNGLIQKSDEGEIRKMLEGIIAVNPAVVADYKSGKESALQFFVGQMMKASKGSANPQAVRKVLLEMLQ